MVSDAPAVRKWWENNPPAVFRRKTDQCLECGVSRDKHFSNDTACYPTVWVQLGFDGEWDQTPVGKWL